MTLKPPGPLGSLENLTELLMPPGTLGLEGQRERVPIMPGSIGLHIGSGKSASKSACARRQPPSIVPDRRRVDGEP